MSSDSQPSTKRVRRIASDPKGQQETNEDVSQVANLVEKRRLQNRISQRNYRNKIRVRLEKLEALVDATANGGPQASGTGNPQSSSGTKPQASGDISRPELSEDVRSDIQNESFDMSTDPSDPWRSIHDFLNLSGTDLEKVCHCTHMEDVGTSRSSHQMETTYPASTLADSIGPGSISTPLLSPEVGAPPSTIVSTDEFPRDLSAGSESYCSDPRPSPATPETDKIDPSFSQLEIDSKSPCHPRTEPNSYPQLGYAYPFPLSTPLVPLSPVAFPSAGVEAGLGNPAGQDRCHGFPSFRPLQTPCFPQQQYVWIPVPVMSLPAEIMKPQRSPAASLNSQVQ